MLLYYVTRYWFQNRECKENVDSRGFKHEVLLGYRMGNTFVRRGSMQLGELLYREISLTSLFGIIKFSLYVLRMFLETVVVGM